MATTIDLEAARATLLEERERLVDQLRELGADEEGRLTGEIDFGGAFADAGAATAERTEVLGLVETLKGLLDDVDAALARIDSGSYGVCERCGEEIEPARLEFRPTSRLCVACKSAST